MRTPLILFLLFYCLQAHSQSLEIEILIPNAEQLWPDVWGIEVNATGELWAANENGNVYHKEGSEWESLSAPGIGTKSVREVKVAPNGDMWIVTQGNGAYRYDGVNWTNYTIANAGMPSNVLTQLAIDKNGKVYVASHLSSAGVSVFDGNSWTFYTANNSLLTSNFVKDLEIDKNGTTLWIASGKAVVRLVNTVMTEFDLYALFQSGMIPYALESDGNGKLWVGTEFGLVAYAGNQWIDHRSIYGAGKVSKLLVDLNNQMWLATPYMGLIQYDGQQLLYYPGSDTIPDQIYDFAMDASGFNYLVGTNGQKIVKFSGGLVSTSDPAAPMKAEFQFYPQPACTFLRIHSQDGFTGECDYYIQDFQGRRIGDGSLSDELDISYLSSGMYLLSIMRDGKIVQHSKFLKSNSN